MTNSFMLGGLYLLMAIMLVLGALISRRERSAQLLVMALAWVAIFAGGFVVFSGCGRKLRASPSLRARKFAFPWRWTAISGSTVR